MAVPSRSLAPLSRLLRSAASAPPLLNPARHFSTSELFVGGLSWSTDDDALRVAFSSFGEVTDARVIVDRESGRSKGYGFVSFNSASEAAAALQTMDGRDLGGRAIRVSQANEKGGGRVGYRGVPSGFGGGGFDGDSGYGRPYTGFGGRGGSVNDGGNGRSRYGGGSYNSYDSTDSYDGSSPHFDGSLNDGAGPGSFSEPRRVSSFDESR